MTIILIISAMSNIGLAIYARHTQRRLRKSSTAVRHVCSQEHTEAHHHSTPQPFEPLMDMNDNDAHRALLAIYDSWQCERCEKWFAAHLLKCENPLHVISDYFYEHGPWQIKPTPSETSH